MNVDEYVEYLFNFNLRWNEIKVLVRPERSWTIDIFYVSHYFVHRGDMHDYDDTA